MKNIVKLILFVCSLSLVLSGCQEKKSTASGPGSQTLSILTGSETRDMIDILNQVSAATGVKIELKQVGSIDGAEQLWAGAKYDVAWFSQSKHLLSNLDFAKKVKLSEKIMISPIVIGIREDSVEKFKIKEKDFTWESFARLADSGLKFAMTDPAASNTGYTALMGVAYAYGRKGENLKEEDIKEDRLRAFFKGHILNSGSSAWLSDAYLADYSKIDAIINYENVILELNNKLPPSQKLKIFYPHEGINTADYPMLLLNGDKREAYLKVTNELKKKETQEKIVKATNRRSINFLVNEKNNFAGGLLVEMPFSIDGAVQEKLLDSYFGKLKKPASFVFVLDTSGSMAEAGREQKLKEAISSLTVSEDASMRWAKIRPRERVWVVPFSSKPYDLRSISLGEDPVKNKADLDALNRYVQDLRMNGGTALFSATLEAVKVLSAGPDEDHQLSIILLTDGESNQGLSADQFIQAFPVVKKGKSIRVFAILFGSANEKQLKAVTAVSGGKVFDGRGNLNKTFKEIRSYQ